MSDAPTLLPRTAPPHEVLRAALAALDRGLRVVLASVVVRHGSAPSTPGQKLALLDHRTAVGTIGGGAVERVVLDRMIEALANPRAVPHMETFRLGASLGMCCGGSVEILIEPLEPLVHVLVVGAGHCGVFTAPLLAATGFRVTLCDGREAAADPARLAVVPAPPVTMWGDPPYPPARPVVEGAVQGADPVRVVHAEHDDPEVLRELPASLDRAALVVMTPDHQLDQIVIEWALARGFGFVGGVGSRAKAARTRARLEAKGVSTADIDRVRMPVGVEIGARSPAEIGVAIAGELVSWRAQLASRHARHAVHDGGDPHTPAAGAHDGGDPHTPAAGAHDGGDPHTPAAGAHDGGDPHTPAAGAHDGGDPHTPAAGAHDGGDPHTPAAGAHDGGAAGAHDEEDAQAPAPGATDEVPA